MSRTARYLLPLAGAGILFGIGFELGSAVGGSSADHPASPAAHEVPVIDEFLQRQLDALSAQLTRIGSALETQPATVPGTQPGQDVPPPAQPPAVTVITENGGFALTRPDAPRPRVTFVNPSAEENEAFETLYAQLDDPDFLAKLSLKDFARSSRLQTLPEPLRQAVIQKAITQYNNGMIAPETFLGPDAPLDR